MLRLSATLPRPTWLWLAGLAAVLLGLAAAIWPPLWLAAAVGLLATLCLIALEPLTGLALALLVGPTAAWEVTFWGNPLSAGQIILGLTLLAWLGRGVLRRQVTIPRTPLNWPLALFMLVGGISLWQADSVWDGVKELGKWWEILLVIWLVFDQVRARWPGAQREAGLATITGMLLLGGVSQAALGAWQFVGRGDGPPAFLIAGRFYRAFGTFQQPNPFGGFLSLNLALVLGAALGLAMALWRTDRLHEMRRQRLIWLALLIGAGGVLGVGLLGSWSRGAWFNFAAAGLTLALFWPRRRAWGLGIALGGLLLALLVWQQGWLPASLADRLTGFVADFRWGDIRGLDINDANYAVLERLAFWQSAREMARQHLWLGVGLGNYAAAYPAFALINWTHSLGHAHNYYLNLLAETGVIGLSVYVLLWSVIIGLNVRLLNRLEWPQRGLALGLLAAWLGLSVHHMLDNLYVNNVYIHLGVMLGVLMVLYSAESSPSPPSA